LLKTCRHTGIRCPRHTDIQALDAHDIQTYAYMHTYASIHMHPYIHAYICMNSYIHMHECIHTYAYIHTYACIHTYTHIHTHTEDAETLHSQDIHTYTHRTLKTLNATGLGHAHGETIPGERISGGGTRTWECRCRLAISV